MLLSKENLTAHLADTAGLRHQMNSIFLAKKGTVSTDGRAMLHIPYPEESEDEFPHVVNEDFEKRDDPHGSILPLPSCTLIAKMLRKNHRPILNYTQMKLAPDSSTVTAIVTDLETTTPSEFKTIEGAFPPVEKAFPSGEVVASVSITLTQLERVVDALKKASGSKQQRGLTSVQIDVRSSKKGVAFQAVTLAETSGKGEVKATGVVMPIVNTDDNDVKPPIVWPN